MAEKATYALAVMLAGAAFVMTGGIHAAETAVRAEEQAAPAASAPAVPTPSPAAPTAVPGKTPRALGVDGSIPFINHGGLRDWRPDGTDALFVQDTHGNWFHAKLIGPCFDIDFAQTVAFETRGDDTLDKFGSVRVRGRQCAFRDFVTSAPPPGKDRKKPDQAKG